MICIRIPSRPVAGSLALLALLAPALLALGLLLPSPADAQRIPQPEPALDALTWIDQRCQQATAVVDAADALALPPMAEVGLHAAGLRAALQQIIDQDPTRLVSRADQWLPQARAAAKLCGELADPAALEQALLAQLPELRATGDLGVLAEILKRAPGSVSGGSIARRVRAALAQQVQPATLHALDSGSATGRERLLSQVARMAVTTALHEALEALDLEFCKPPARVFVDGFCSGLEGLAGSVLEEGPLVALQRGIASDLRALPERAVMHSGLPERTVTTAWVALHVLSAMLDGQDARTALCGLSDLACPAGLDCDAAVLATAREAGVLVRVLRLDARVMDAIASSEVRRRHVELAVEQAWREGMGSLGRQATALGHDKRVELVRLTLSAMAALESGAGQAPSARDLGRASELMLAYMVEALAVDEQTRRWLSLPVELARAHAADDAEKIAALTLQAVRQAGARLPGRAGEALELAVALLGADSADVLAELMRNSAFVRKAIAEAVETVEEKQDTRAGLFEDAPDARPDDATRTDKPAIAEYLTGLRAAWVFQHWTPQDIANVNYNTTGLNLLRLEAIANFEDLPELRRLQGYLRYEFAPGGEADQDALIELIEKESSGWQQVVADLGVALPFMSGERTERGPVFGFEQWFFLVAAQSLQDYWYYDEATVALLVPGDVVRTNTVMTTVSLGVNSTSLHPGGNQSWGWEAGAYYMDYRKPYTHERVTAVDGAAIFNSTFEGYGGYAEIAKYLGGIDAQRPIALAAHAKLGPAEVKLDDVSAEDVLPGDASLWMLELRARVEVPIVWVGGFYFGGHGYTAYRSFGDFFSAGEPDPARVNDRSLNDDLIFGLSAQTGYFF